MMIPEDSEKPHISLPAEVCFVLDSLTGHGYEAFTVGGCVRDSLIGRTPGDWDITTSARPYEIKHIFKRTVDTGIAHGTVTVLIPHDGQPFCDKDRDGIISSCEVTTYRIDGEYSDHRHPEAVSFTSLLSEDLKRRDFTVNAMAYNEHTGLVDLYGGREDLEKHLIRCVGDPDERFDEDALRILRAVRFCAQLGFDIEPDTAASACAHADSLKLVSKERIYAELTKLLCSANPDKITLVYDMGMSEYIASDMNRADTRLLCAVASKLSEVSLDKRYVRFAFLLAGQPAEMIKKFLKELKADNDTIRKTSFLGSMLLSPLSSDRYEIKKILNYTTPGLFETLLYMKELCAESSEADFYKEKCSGENLQLISDVFRDIYEKGEPLSLKDLAVSGHDLVRTGVFEGQEIGRLLSVMHEDVLKHPEHNEKHYLLSAFAGIADSSDA